MFLQLLQTQVTTGLNGRQTGHSPGTGHRSEVQNEIPAPDWASDQDRVYFKSDLVS